IAPRFREGRYADGLQAAADAVFARVGGAGRPRRAPPAGTPWLPVLALAFVVAVIAGMGLAAERMSRRVRAGRRAYTVGPSGWYVPSAGGWPSGGWGGGGSSGGGFSGGGGSFGGGGASGDW